MTRTDFLTAMRGSRLEVRSKGQTTSGRLLSVEQEDRTTDSGTTYHVTDFSVMTDSGEMRNFELGPAVSVRLAERDLNQKVGRYLNLIGSSRARDLRRMSISAGSGDRDIFVSYISEVPVWRSTYRIILPEKAGEKPLLQGWAIVGQHHWRGLEGCAVVFDCRGAAIVYSGHLAAAVCASASVPLLSGVGGGSNLNFLTNTSYYYLLTSSGKDGATVGLVNLTSSGATAGAITGTLWQDFSGTIGTTALSGTYTITDPSWARVTFSGSGLSNAPVAYVEGGSGYPSPVRGVTVGTDSDAESGTLFFQSVAAPSYTMANYAFHAGYSDVLHTSSGITTKIGVVTLDGSGGFTGTVDVSGPNGLSSNQSVSGTYLVNPDGSGDVAPGPLVTSYFRPQ